MKNNVDLTENNDFRKSSLSNTFRKSKNYFSNVVDGIQYDYHYISKLSESLGYLDDKGAIYQGNRRERLSKKLEASFCDRITCDRCGAFIFPYRNDTLCDYCNADMEYDLHKATILRDLFST